MAVAKGSNLTIRYAVKPKPVVPSPSPSPSEEDKPEETE